MTRKILAKLLEEATEVRGKRSEDHFGEFFGCVEDRIEIVRKGIRQFGEDRTILGGGQTEEWIEENTLCSQELGLVLSFSAASGKSSQASAADELQEREAMRDWSETVEVL